MLTTHYCATWLYKFVTCLHFKTLKNCVFSFGGLNKPFQYNLTTVTISFNSLCVFTFTSYFSQFLFCQRSTEIRKHHYWRYIPLMKRLENNLVNRDWEIALRQYYFFFFFLEDGVILFGYILFALLCVPKLHKILLFVHRLTL